MTPITTIEEYLAAVRAGLDAISAVERDEALAELESLLRADAERTGVAAAIAALGDPVAYAAHVIEALGDAAPEGPQPQGRLLGMPYDFRGASTERVGERLWNPADPRIFMPRLFGMGWTINFGALAVKLHLIRPDDTGDESFEAAPTAAVAVTVAIPALLAATTLAAIALTWGELPAEVPVHWGASGAPDDWAAKALAFGMILALTVLPVILTYARVLRRGASARSRILSASVLSLLAALGLGMTLVTIADADGGSSGTWILAAIVGGFALSFLTLFVPLRLGMRAEWRESGVLDQRRS
jgi:hypothetical protein